MTRPARLNRFTVLLLSTCLLLALVIANQLRSGLQVHQAADAERPEAGAAGGAPLERSTYTPPPMQVYGEILERPLFRPGREPPPPPPPEEVAAKAAPREPLKLKLEGVAINREARVAVVRDLTSREILRLGEGDSHKGWTLEQVHARKVTFERRGEKRELELEEDASVRPRR